MSEHTSGTWYLKGTYGVIAHHPDGYLVTVAGCYADDATAAYPNYDEAAANARLMAAAPDLLAACLAASSRLVDDDDHYLIYSMVKAAIDKATGTEKE